jgi:hypothetical protein
MTLGWQVQPQFSVVQGATSRSALEGLVEFFGCGRIYVNQRRDNHREAVLRYCVQRLDDQRSRIDPFFASHPLQTQKQESFVKFGAILELMAERRHLTRSGLIAIAELVETMNHKKPSQCLRILRDHTPAIS